MEFGRTCLSGGMEHWDEAQSVAELPASYKEAKSLTGSAWLIGGECFAFSWVDTDSLLRRLIVRDGRIRISRPFRIVSHLKE
jgi:hypothetical protein